MNDFLKSFQDAAAAEGCRAAWSPALFIEAWSEFVHECEIGFDSDIYEYENERSVRDAIWRILTSMPNKGELEFSQFSERVAEIDARFMLMLHEGPTIDPEARHWWRATLPAHSGEQLAKDARRLYGVSLRVV